MTRRRFGDMTAADVDAGIERRLEADLARYEHAQDRAQDAESERAAWLESIHTCHAECACHEGRRPLPDFEEEER